MTHSAMNIIIRGIVMPHYGDKDWSRKVVWMRIMSTFRHIMHKTDLQPWSCVSNLYAGIHLIPVFFLSISPLT